MATSTEICDGCLVALRSLVESGVLRIGWLSVAGGREAMLAPGYAEALEASRENGDGSEHGSPQHG